MTVPSFMTTSSPSFLYETASNSINNSSRVMGGGENSVTITTLPPPPQHHQQQHHLMSSDAATHLTQTPMSQGMRTKLYDTVSRLGCYKEFGKLKGIVSRDFGGLQMILRDRIYVPDVPLEVYSFLNLHLHIFC